MELEQVYALWEQFKVWIITFGTSGVLLVAWNVGLKLIGNARIKGLISNLGTMRNDVKNLVGGVVADYKDIKKDVGQVIGISKEVALQVQDATQSIKLTIPILIDLMNVMVAVSPVPVEAKRKALEVVKTLGDDFKSIELLADSIERSKVQVGTLDKISNELDKE